jgi:15-cis-phytoene synthase
MTPVLRDGYRRARLLTRAHARSFHAASIWLDATRRRSAMALYAFCRRLDDLVDEPDAGDASRIARRLGEARFVLRALGAGRTPLLARAPWHPHELAALGDTIARHRIPIEPLLALVDGVEMDVVKTRYATFAELELYCHRVAGTVGLTLAPVLGYDDPVALSHAADLGRAMQLTNILRDIGEDLARGRLYLPLDELRAAGIEESDLEAGRVDDRFRAFMCGQIARARACYARAVPGIRHLTGYRARLAVALMATLYQDILRVIERQGYDVFGRRASVSGRRKVALAAATMWTGRFAA